jgi:NUDIX domain
MEHYMRFTFLFAVALLVKLGSLAALDDEQRFFQATKQRPYHLSIGAVLFDEQGRVACHHYADALGHKDIYILMRESMENEETISDTLLRGLKEEFGAVARPVAFLGCQSGFIPSSKYPFEKTTLYVVCASIECDPTKRDLNDPESASTIRWLQPDELITLMQKQGERCKRIDLDESEMILRALPYIKSSTCKENL